MFWSLIHHSVRESFDVFLLRSESVMSHAVICTLPYPHTTWSCVLFLQVSGKAVVFEPVTAYISFTNPLPVPLKGGVFTVEGAGLLSATEIRVKWVMSQPSSLHGMCRELTGNIHNQHPTWIKKWGPTHIQHFDFMTGPQKQKKIKLTMSLLLFQGWCSSGPEGVCQALVLTHADRGEEAPGGLWLWQTEGREGSRHCGRPQEIRLCNCWTLLKTSEPTEPDTSYIVR